MHFVRTVLPHMSLEFFKSWIFWDLKLLQYFHTQSVITPWGINVKDF